MLAVVLSVSAVPGCDSTPREIRIVARDMAFYLEGSAEPNPVVRVRRREHVRVVFVNEDAGMKHDFSVPAWGLVGQVLSGRGETSLIFRAPARGSVGTYACTPHAAMMKGTIMAVE